MTLFRVTFREPDAIHGDTTLCDMFDGITVGALVEAVNYDHAVELARDQVGVGDQAEVVEVRALAAQVAA